MVKADVDSRHCRIVAMAGSASMLLRRNEELPEDLVAQKFTHRDVGVRHLMGIPADRARSTCVHPLLTCVQALTVKRERN